MSKSRGIATIIVGIFLAVVAVILFVHDAEYIFTGNTVNLNEILSNGEELPRDKYVTYTCEIPLGNYAETQQYLNGLIPLPGKTQQYAMLDDTGLILSAEIKDNAKLEEMDNAIDEFWDNDAQVSVTLTGCFEINSSEMDSYLTEYINYIFDDDLESYEIVLTSYAINTTKTRASQFMLSFLGFLLGVAMIVIPVRKFR